MIGEALVRYVLDEFREAEVSLHSADPGRTGANEVTGNRYRRQQPPSYEDMPHDGIRSTTDVLFTDLPLTEIAFAGFWCEGRFIEGRPVPQRSAKVGDGYRIHAGAITAYLMEAE